MFEDRSYKRTLYSAPQSVASLVAALLEPAIAVPTYVVVRAWFDEPIVRLDLSLCLLVLALTFPGRSRFKDRPFVVGECRVTGQSTLSGRLDCFWSAHTGLNPCVQDGVTGWLAWNYLLTGKLKFNTRISHDTQANSVFTQVGDDVDVGPGADAAADQRPAAHTELGLWRQDLVQRLAGLLSAAPEKKLRRLAGTRMRPPAQPRPPPPAGRHLAATRNCRLNCSLPLNDRDPSRSATQPITVLPNSAAARNCSAQYVPQ